MKKKSENPPIVLQDDSNDESNGVNYLSENDQSNAETNLINNTAESVQANSGIIVIDNPAAVFKRKGTRKDKEQDKKPASHWSKNWERYVVATILVLFIVGFTCLLIYQPYLLVPIAAITIVNGVAPLAFLTTISFPAAVAAIDLIILGAGILLPILAGAITNACVAIVIGFRNRHVKEEMPVDSDAGSSADDVGHSDGEESHSDDEEQYQISDALSENNDDMAASSTHHEPLFTSSPTTSRASTSVLNKNSSGPLGFSDQSSSSESDVESELENDDNSVVVGGSFSS